VFEAPDYAKSAVRWFVADLPVRSVELRIPDAGHANQPVVAYADRRMMQCGRGPTGTEIRVVLGMRKADRYCGADFNLHHCGRLLDLVVAHQIGPSLIARWCINLPNRAAPLPH
jgi:hypothetical protein